MCLIVMRLFGMDLAPILSAGESLTVEFKRDINDKDLYEAVVCMANGQGGLLLIGVEDNAQVVGARPRHGGGTSPERLGAAIQNNTEPPLGVSVELCVVDDQEVIAINVPQADPGPAGTKAGLYVKRVLDTRGKPACVPLTPQELVSRAYITRGLDYATAPAEGATLADLDPAQFDRFRRLCMTSGGDGHLADLSDEDMCLALGLVPRSAPVSLGMILLFGEPEALERWVPAAEVLFQDERAGTQANERMRVPLFQAAEDIQARLDQRHTATEIIVGLQRIDIPLVSTLTRRESVANALVHRDYSTLGAVTVGLTGSEFTVTSPGGLPPGVTVDNLLEQSRPRSLVLADAFKRAGLVERRGKGVNEMFESQLRAGRDAPDYSRSNSEIVVVSVPLGTSDIDLVRFLAVLQSQRQKDLSLDQLRLVHAVRTSGAATGAELVDQLAMSPVVVRNATTSLIEAGVLESRGNGRARRFHLAPTFYALSEDKAAYVRVRPVAPLQQEQMVLEYVGAYGSISRAQAADLCHVSPTAARSLLKRLTSEGKLELRGQRRGAHYVHPGAKE